MSIAIRSPRLQGLKLRQRWVTLSDYDRATLRWSLVAAFVLRGIFILFSILRAPVAVQVDTERYVGIAYAHGFATWFNMNDPAGYPILLRLTGSDMHFYVGILLLQLAMSVATVYLGWKLGQRYLTARANRWLAVLLVINPVSVFFSSQLMTECSFTFLFLLSLLWLIEGLSEVGRGRPTYANEGVQDSEVGRERPTYAVASQGADIETRSEAPARKISWKLILSGLALSFSGLIRPTSVVLAGVLTLVLLVFAIRKIVAWQHALTFVVAAWSLMFLYAVGLKLRYDYFGLSAKGPTMLTYYYTGPVMQSLGYSDSFIDSTMNTLPSAFEYLDGRITGNQFANAHNHFFWEFLKQHPVAYLKVYVLGWSQMLVWPGVGLFQLHRHFGLEPRVKMEEMQYNKVFYYVVRGDFAGEMQLLQSRIDSSSIPVLIMWVVAAILPPLTLLFALIGLWRFGRRKNVPILERSILLFILAGYIFLVPHMAASTRFRMPINPLLALFAIIAIQDYRKQRQTAKLAKL